MKININNKEIKADNFELPLLISGSEGSGTSFFSVVFVSELIGAGKKIIYFCQAEPAVKLLKQLIGARENVKIIEPGNIKLFKQTLIKTKNLDRKIVFVKNIEKTLDQESFELIKRAKSFILSGDADSCIVLSPSCFFGSKIFFSNSEKFDFQLPDNLKKYEGFTTSSKVIGIVGIRE